MTPSHGSKRVLIVDDSALMRKLLTEILSRDPELAVVGTAIDPYDAREKIKALHPDVLTLDIEMPKMDGLTFLRNLMRLRPMPVVMISSLTERGADATLAALELGAVDFVPKPRIDLAESLSAQAAMIAQTVKAAANAKMRPREGRGGVEILHQGKAKASLTSLETTDKLIALGASTGGTEAIAAILAELPPDAPGVVIAQHIPEVFSARFANRLNDTCAIAVSEAKDGDPIVLGHAYVAPGGRHLRVERSGARFICRVSADDPVNRHRPSVDVLFRSIARHVGRNAVAALLTGMGADGAQGLLEMRQAGCATLAQDKDTSVVWGMPGEAVKREAAAEVLPLPKIAGRLQELLRNPRRLA